jgi:cytochrome P450
MATATRGDLYYDPYDLEIYADPHPVFRRLREEEPLYYNERHDFYAVSRYQDVDHGLVDHESFISRRGAVLDMIKANLELPPGTLNFEDPPVHTARRGLLSRVFTPRKMNALEPKVRQLCAGCLDPLVGAGHLDFIVDLGARVPMQVIGMLLGIPEQDQELVRAYVDESLRTEPGQPQTYDSGHFSGEIFADYIDWRTEHPSDDLMTELIQAEFEDENGVTRKLTRTEVLSYVNVVAAAGSETTTRLIGWIGKLLGDHPDQLRRLTEDPSLVPNAIEEVLRFEPPALQVARYVGHDVEYYGHIVPEGSALLFIVAAANRDDRRFPEGDRFDISRKMGSHLTFGYGIHFCLGSALARLEARTVTEELVKRFREWRVDGSRARFAPTTTVRGYESLPALTVTR